MDIRCAKAKCRGIVPYMSSYTYSYNKKKEPIAYLVELVCPNCYSKYRFSIPVVYYKEEHHNE